MNRTAPEPLRRTPTQTVFALTPVAIVTLALAATSAIADTYPRRRGIDAINYTFRLTLRDDIDEIAGEATIDLRFAEDGLTEFALDLTSTKSGKGMAVSGVTSRGAPVKYKHQDDRLLVSLDAPSKSGERKSFTVTYRGIPRTGLRIGKNRHGDRTFNSENWPNKAHEWLPMIDHPYDKATSEFIVTAPALYQVVANGLLQEERDLGDGRRLTHWKESVPIASWLNAVGVAQFASHHHGLVKGIPLESWVYHQDRDSVVPALEKPARRVLEFYGEHIGPFPYEKLANVQAAGLNGGTEHASVIFYGERTVLGRDVTDYVAHEIAHQRFGDSVTESDWDDVWLSEGFATYFTLLFTEHDRGRDAFLAGLKRSRDSVITLEKRNAGLAVIHDNLSDMGRVLNGLVYQKGGWTLHMLRQQVGTDTFWTGIRDYYKRYRDSSASTDDFRHVMEENSGQDLSWFFRQWLKRAGSPVLQGSWLFRDKDKRIEIDLEQVQPGEPYRLPLEIGISTEGSSQSRTEKVEMTKQKQHFDFAAEKAPRSVTLDPNCWVLMKASFGPHSDSK
jgi:aminopeptidase N